MLSAKDVRTVLRARYRRPARPAALLCHRPVLRKLLSPLTLNYVKSVLKSALAHAVREEEIPRNVARDVRTGSPRSRRFELLTADEARQFPTAAEGHRLHALLEPALHTGFRVGGLTRLPTNTRSSERRIGVTATV